MPDAARHPAFLSSCLRCISLLFLVLSIPAPLQAASGKAVFVTWQGFEADKLACIWLVKRFIDPHAEFKFLPPGSEIKEGIPFDVPYGNLRRTATRPTFSQFLSHYRLDDPRLKELEKFIHEVEINTWGAFSFPQSEKISQFVKRLLLTTSDEKERIRQSLVFFDGIYAALATKKNNDN